MRSCEILLGNLLLLQTSLSKTNVEDLLGVSVKQSPTRWMMKAGSQVQFVPIHKDIRLKRLVIGDW